jgi:hypothetical protein
MGRDRQQGVVVCALAAPQMPTLLCLGMMHTSYGLPSLYMHMTALSNIVFVELLSLRVMWSAADTAERTWLLCVCHMSSLLSHTLGYLIGLQVIAQLDCCPLVGMPARSKADFPHAASVLPIAAVHEPRRPSLSANAVRHFSTECIHRG